MSANHRVTVARVAWYALAMAEIQPCGCARVEVAKDVFQDYVCAQHQRAHAKLAAEWLNGQAAERDQLRKDRDELVEALERWVAGGHLRSPACICPLCEDSRSLLARIKASELPASRPASP